MIALTFRFNSLFDPRGFDRLVRGLYFGLKQRGNPILTPLESPLVQLGPTPGSKIYRIVIGEAEE